MVNDLEIIRNIEILFENKIVLYGAGRRGGSMLKELMEAGIEVFRICDSDIALTGQSLHQVEIISPDILQELDSSENVVIIITTIVGQYMDEIVKQIGELKLRTSHVYSGFGLKVALAQNLSDPRIKERYRLLSLHGEKIKGFIDEHKVKKYLTECFDRIVRNDEDQILIYQPGKVGSNTIGGILKKADIPYVQTHYLSEKVLKDIHPQLITQMLEINQSKVKIVTLVREPIGRALASLFQYLENSGTALITSMSGTIEEKFEEMITGDIFSEDEIYRCFCEANWLDWFDYELKEVFHVDVFAYPFDREKGYSIIRQDQVEVLIMKLEKLNHLEKVIGDFLGLPSFELVNLNDGDSKAYKYLYKNIREVIKIPQELVSLYYDNNPRMDHFYTTEEQKAFLAKWKNNIGQ